MGHRFGSGRDGSSGSDFGKRHRDAFGDGCGRQRAELRGDGLAVLGVSFIFRSVDGSGWADSAGDRLEPVLFVLGDGFGWNRLPGSIVVFDRADEFGSDDHVFFDGFPDDGFGSVGSGRFRCGG